MCAHVQNLESLSVLNIETCLTGSSTGLTISSRAQTGLTDRLTSLTGPVIPDNSDLVPRVENSASDNLKHDKANVVDWRNSLLIIWRIQVKGLIEKFSDLLLSSHW
jgi:hypothetical protein